MARQTAGGSLGCLGTLIVLWPFWWAYDKCTGGEEHRAAERANQEERESRERIRRVDVEAQERREQAERKRQDAETAAQMARDASTRISKLKPYERAALLVKCVKDDDCPLGKSDPNIILEAASSKSERKQLAAAVAQLERAKERTAKAQERADAPLLCCDGSGSPSCTCGNPRRGCCSHHGGVCGCTADQ